jgi:hypothetical protein
MEDNIKCGVYNSYSLKLFQDCIWGEDEEYLKHLTHSFSSFFLNEYPYFLLEEYGLDYLALISIYLFHQNYFSYALQRIRD